MSMRDVKTTPKPVVEVFQKLSLAGLAYWLEIQGEAVTVGEESALDFLAVLAKDEDIPVRIAAGATAVRSAFLVTEPIAISMTQKMWVGNRTQFSRLKCLVMAVERVRHKLFGPYQVAFAPVAPLQTDAIAFAAWADPAFQRQVAMLMRAHLRKRVFLYPDTGDGLHVNAPLLWAAAAAGMELVSLSGKQAMKDEIKARLLVQSKSRISKDGWAGFWDAYLATLAAKKGADFDRAQWTIDLSSAEDALPQFEEGWRHKIPGYAPLLLTGDL